MPCLIRNSSQDSSSWVSIPEFTNHAIIDSFFCLCTPSFCQFKGKIDGKRTNFYALIIISFTSPHWRCQYFQKNNLDIRNNLYITLNYVRCFDKTGSSYFRSLLELNYNNETLVPQFFHWYFTICCDEVDWFPETYGRWKIENSSDIWSKCIFSNCTSLKLEEKY